MRAQVTSGCLRSRDCVKRRQPAAHRQHYQCQCGWLMLLHTSVQHSATVHKQGPHSHYHSPLRSASPSSSTSSHRHPAIDPRAAQVLSLLHPYWLLRHRFCTTKSSPTCLLALALAQPSFLCNQTSATKVTRRLSDRHRPLSKPSGITRKSGSRAKWNLPLCKRTPGRLGAPEPRLR